MKIYNIYKITHLFATLILYLGSIASARSDETIDPEVLKQYGQHFSIKEKEDYLNSIIADNNGSAETDNARKSSALFLLGNIGGKTAINTLIKNITYIEKRSNGSPASRALVRIGEPAVSELLNTFKDEVSKASSDEEKIKWTALTIGFKKSKNRYPGAWIEFLKQQKELLPKRAYDKLRRYAIIVD